jgi:hypothetical protein
MIEALPIEWKIADVFRLESLVFELVIIRIIGRVPLSDECSSP